MTRSIASFVAVIGLAAGISGCCPCGAISSANAGPAQSYLQQVAPTAPAASVQPVAVR